MTNQNSEIVISRLTSTFSSLSNKYAERDKTYRRISLSHIKSLVAYEAGMALIVLFQLVFCYENKVRAARRISNKAIKT